LGGGLALTARDFACKIADALGRPAPRRGPPAIPYRLALHAASVGFRTTGRLVAFVHDRELLVADNRVSIGRARAELGYAPRGDIDSAVRAMVAAFHADGRLDPARPAA
jgi:nucleoside-diphosphate-sugar epimerase